MKLRLVLSPAISDKGVTRGASCLKPDGVIVTEGAGKPIASLSVDVSSIAVVPSFKVVFIIMKEPDGPSNCIFVIPSMINVTYTSSATTPPRLFRVISITQLPPLVFMVLSKTAALFAVVDTLNPPSMFLKPAREVDCTFVKVSGTSR